MTTKRKLPEVLWRLFSHRAKNLATTIVSLTRPDRPISCRHRRRRRICLCCCENPYSFLLRPADPVDYRNLLRRCYVVRLDNAPSLNPSPDQRWSQREIVERVIEMTIGDETAPSNVICKGYDKKNRSSMIVELLTSSAWSLLLERVGDDLMVYLLKYTSIFLPLTRNNHQQVAGFPIVLEMKMKKGDYTHFTLERQLASSYSSKESILGKRSQPLRQKPQKKPRGVKLQEYSDVPSPSTIIPVDVDSMQGSRLHDSNMMPAQSPYFKVRNLVCNWDLVNRQSIFYDSDCFSSVLPRKNALNGLKPNYEGAKFLMKNIFGLSSTNASAESIPCSHSSMCTFRSPCPYHSLAKLLKLLIRRSRNCQHKKLLEKHCVVPCLDQDTRNKSFVLENVPVDSGIDTDKCKKVLEADDSALKLNRSYCGRIQVESFVWAVCRSIIPHDLLGTSYNWRKLRQIISRFIRMRRYEKLSIRQCMHKLKISEFPFLSKLSSFIDHRVAEKAKRLKNNNSKEYNLENSGADTEHVRGDTKHVLLTNWIFWFFSFLVVPLVKANFYVTETEHGRQEVFYYLKPVWGKFKESGIVRLKEEYSYDELSETAVRKIVNNRAFGFSKLRLLPKEKGMRILANLRAPSKLPANYSPSRGYPRKQPRFLKSVNSVLREIHAVLKGLQLKEPEKLGSSVFDYNDVYRKMCPFLADLKKGSMNLPALFIVTCDVSRAFDSIDQNKLLSVMKEVIRKDGYHLQQSHQIVCVKQYLRVDESLILIDQDIKNGFTSSTSTILFGSSHAINANQYCNSYVTKESLFHLLNEHVKGNVMKFDRKYYIQRMGIAQGSVLSSLLCSLYYGNLERNVIIPFIERTGSGCTEKQLAGHSSSDSFISGHLKDDTVVSRHSYLLLRFIDDFIFISTTKEQAANLLSRFCSGFSDYNCYMNAEKFSFNFTIENQLKIKSNKVHVAEDDTSFHRWAGLLVNSRTLEVQADYTRYHSKNLLSSLTVCWQRRLGYHLRRKLCDFMRPKCHPIFYDSNINSAAVVRLNIYQAFLLSAMKFHCYVSEISYMCKFWPSFYFKMIENSFRYMQMLIRNRMRLIARSCNFRPNLNLKRGEVEWLGLKAFIEVLHRKQSRYRALLAMLRRKFSAHELTRRESSDLAYAVGRSQNSVMWKIKY